MAKQKNGEVAVGQQQQKEAGLQIKEPVDLKELSAALGHLSQWLQGEIQKGQTKRERPSEPVENIALVVRRTRKEQGVSLHMLAALSGVSLGTIQSIEKGKTTVSLEIVMKVLGALGKKLWIV